MNSSVEKRFLERSAGAQQIESRVSWVRAYETMSMQSNFQPHLSR